MESNIFEVEIKYYCREKCYGKVQEIIKLGLIQEPNNYIYIFYNGLSHILSARYQEGIRELNLLQSNDDVALAVIMCLIHAHKRSLSVDKETIQQLEKRMKESRKNSTTISLYYAALFFFFTDRLDKAYDTVNKIIKMDSNFEKGLTLKSWIEMYKNPNNLSPKIADTFEAFTSDDELDSSLGLVTFKYLQKDYVSAIIQLESLILKYPQSDILLIEKIKNELALYNWERVLEISDRLLFKEHENLLGIKYKILFTICKKGDYIEAADQLDKFYEVLEKNETKNARIFYDLAKLFSGVCGRSSSILSRTYRFVKYAAELHPSNIDYLTELGYHCFMQNMIKDAVHFFKSATRVDDNSISALCGLTLCQMSENGASEQIEQQIELLNELMGGNNKHPLLLLMSAKLESKYPEKAVNILIESSSIHFSKSHYLPFGCEYLKQINPDFVLELVEEFLKYAPKKPMVIINEISLDNDEIFPPTVVQSFKLLDILTKSCPGLVSAVYSLAKLQFLYGKINNALQNAQNIIDNIDQSFANAHLLLSQIQIQQNFFNKAEQSLEVCLSYNFKVRDNPMYHLLQGIVMKHKKKLSEALACYTSAVNLISSKSINYKKSKNDFENELALPDKATLYLELITTHIMLSQHAEALSVMQVCMNL